VTFAVTHLKDKNSTVVFANVGQKLCSCCNEEPCSSCSFYRASRQILLGSDWL